MDLRNKFLRNFRLKFFAELTLRHSRADQQVTQDLASYPCMENTQRLCRAHRETPTDEGTGPLQLWLSVSPLTVRGRAADVAKH